MGEKLAFMLIVMVICGIVPSSATVPSAGTLVAWARS